ncbi:hypothetical protein CAE01nite_06720 [Cellulomonas aerilata]|uniref:Uncharacterized protein n=1 Tax=Cellulomonas aerilata TaxID=515326 RepID=A0A512D976_9CELL|nr:hypothetical protein CAE01nite_06720 [Cellulomonas aerilata]
MPAGTREAELVTSGPVVVRVAGQVRRSLRRSSPTPACGPNPRADPAAPAENGSAGAPPCA